MNIGIRLHDTIPGTLRERLEYVRRQGFTCAHVALSKVLDGFAMQDAPEKLTEGFAREVRKDFADTGMQCAVLGCYLNLADPDPEPYPEPAPEPEPDPDNSVEVVSFERVTLDDGSQADMALVNINGEEAAIVDINLDGWADAMMADIDHSGDISDNEIVPINSDQPIAMAPLAEAVNYDYDDPINGGGSTMVVDDDGGCCPPDCGDDGCCPPTDDDNLLIVSNDGSDGIIPDYVNNGDVSDMAGDVTLV